MTIIAGIDEAGFGPVLGPLVVSATIFEVPQPLLDISMWQALAGSVCRAPSVKRKSLIPIADSKKLYSGLRGEGGLEHLERGVLTMLACSEGWRHAAAATPSAPPATLDQLLSVVCPGARQHAADCPWYRDLSLKLPHCIDAVGLVLGSNALAARMGKAGLRLLTMQSEVVLEREFNRLVEAVDNKSSMLFDIAARLLARIWQLIPRGEHARIFVDHQGGRVHYLPGLQRVFEGCQFKVVEEREDLSEYMIFDDARTLHIQFLVKGEDSHMSVALASMLSKYLRELFMVLLNRYWATHVPGIQPTAGYYTDGRRFYEQILPLIGRLGLDQNMIYRQR